MREMIALLQEIDERYLGDEWSAPAFGDLPDGFRQIASMLEGGCRLIVRSGSRAAVLPPHRDRAAQDDRRQRRRDLLHRADPRRSCVPRHRQPRRRGLPVVHRRAAARRRWLQHRDRGRAERRHDFDFATDGSFEIFFGGEPRDRATGSSSSTGASELIVRCYFEEPTPTAADPNRHRPADDRSPSSRSGRPRRGTTRRSRPVGGAPRLPAESHARATQAGRTRAAHVGVDDTERLPAAGAPGHVRVRGRRRGVLDGAVPARAGRSARHHRSLAASAGSRASRCGRATCRRTTTRTAPPSRNRASTTLEPDGSFRIVLAHADPGVPNWIDTEGQGLRHGVLALLPAREARSRRRRRRS